MKPLSFVLKATSVAVLAAFSSGSFSHSEPKQPRFVSPTGVDQGRCDVEEKPCLTIEYASSIANKGDDVLMAAGSYQMTNADSVFYLLSGITEVKPGYSTKDKFQSRSVSKNATTLLGVPVQFAEQLRKKGFRVISDLASLSPESRAEIDTKLADYQLVKQRQSNEVCTNGSAGGFSCDNVDLLAHIPIADFNLSSGTEGTDIWGHVDLNTGREYAIIVFSDGFSVVDVTEPTQPNIIGTIPAQSTRWRDVKVNQFFDQTAGKWKAYAYITADKASVGLTIVDLNDMANGISIANIDKTDLFAHNVFISNVDYSTGVALTGLEAFVHLAGPDTNNGAFNSFSINNLTTQVSPRYRPDGSSGYSHDVSAMVVTDERVGSQCVDRNGSCEIFFDYNEDVVKIWDKTNNSSPNMLSTIAYSGAGYVHSGWTSEDGKYVFVHDELDEAFFGHNTRVRIFDISDLNNPQMVGTWEGPTGAIDHNGFVRGNRYYMSNYAYGLQILDITDPANPTSVGSFDTYGVNDSAGFSGAWGVYPFLPSGNLIVSDINGGLYILADKTVGTATQDSVKFSAKSYEVDEGDEVRIMVERAGPSNQAVTVQYETQAGSGSTDDFTMTNGTLQWAAGDTAAKEIVVSTLSDTVDDEDTELFFLRLFNPTGGVSLAAPNLTMINLKGVAQPSAGTFASEDMEVKEIDGTISVPVTRIGDLNEALTVSYDVSGGTATVGSDFELSAGELTWAADESGSKNIDVVLTNDGDSESVEEIVLSLSQNTPGNADQEMVIKIRDDDSNQAPEVTVSDDSTVNVDTVVNLAAVASDPEGYPLSYKWTQTGGTQVTVEDDTASTISFTAPNSATEIVFELSVTDDFGVSTTASVTVTVEEPSTPTQPTQPTTPTSSGGGGAMMYIVGLLGLVGLTRRRKPKA